MTEPKLATWFETPLGQYVLAREQLYFDEAVADIFGFNAVQIGLPEVDLLRASRIPLRVSIGTGPPAKVFALGGELPVATQSVDLVVLPHVLEFAGEPHQILREVDRIMMPEGRVIICGFNPWSLWGMRQAIMLHRDEAPWHGRFISLTRMKDWLALLGFDVSAGRLCCYAPPFSTQRWLDRFSFMEPAGDRWWGIAGGVYLLQAIKRVRGMRIITPQWEGAAARKGIVPVRAQRAAMHGAPGNVVPLTRRR